MGCVSVGYGQADDPLQSVGEPPLSPVSGAHLMELEGCGSALAERSRDFCSSLSLQHGSAQNIALPLLL